MAASPIFPRSFLLLWSVTFLAYFSFQLTTASLPLYAVSLGADDAAIGLLTGVIALGSLVSRPWVGQWLDRGGARWSMPAAGGLFAVSAGGFFLSRAVTDPFAFPVLLGGGHPAVSTPFPGPALRIGAGGTRGGGARPLGG